MPVMALWNTVLLMTVAIEGVYIRIKDSLDGHYLHAFSGPIGGNTIFGKIIRKVCLG
jgi:hypothetical protein